MPRLLLAKRKANNATAARHLWVQCGGSVVQPVVLDNFFGCRWGRVFNYVAACGQARKCIKIRIY